MTESKKPAASTLYGGTRTRRVTVRDIQAAKQAGEWQAKERF